MDARLGSGGAARETILGGSRWARGGKSGVLSSGLGRFSSANSVLSGPRGNGVVTVSAYCF